MDKLDDLYNIPSVVIEKLTAFQKLITNLEIKMASMQTQNDFLKQENDQLRFDLTQLQNQCQQIQSEQIKSSAAFNISLQKIQSSPQNTPIFEPQTHYQQPQLSPNTPISELTPLIAHKISELLIPFQNEFEAVYKLLAQKPSKRAVAQAIKTRFEAIEETIYNFKEAIQTVLKKKADVESVNIALSAKVDFSNLQNWVHQIEKALSERSQMDSITPAITAQTPTNLQPLLVKIQANSAKISEMESRFQSQNTNKKLNELALEIKNKASIRDFQSLQKLINESGSDRDILEVLQQRPTVNQVVQIVRGIVGERK